MLEDIIRKVDSDPEVMKVLNEVRQFQIVKPKEVLLTSTGVIVSKNKRKLNKLIEKLTHTKIKAFEKFGVYGVHIAFDKEDASIPEPQRTQVLNAKWRDFINEDLGEELGFELEDC